MERRFAIVVVFEALRARVKRLCSPARPGIRDIAQPRARTRKGAHPCPPRSSHFARFIGKASPIACLGSYAIAAHEANSIRLLSRLREKAKTPYTTPALGGYNRCHLAKVTACARAVPDSASSQS